MSNPSWADEADDIFFANEAGQIVGSAEPCGFKLEPGKLKSFTETRIVNLAQMARMNFTASTSIQGNSIAEMSETEKVAHCALNRALAEKYELLATP